MTTNLEEEQLSITKVPLLMTGKLFLPDLKYHEGRGYYEDVTLDIKGRIASIKYYLNYDFITRIPSGLLVNERYTFTENALGFVQTRTKQIDYYDIDGNVICTNDTIQDKPYGFMASKEEGERRRKNLTNTATGALIQMVGLSNAIIFSATIGQQISSYVFGNDTQSLKDSVTNSIEAYMTQQVKDSILLILNNA